MKGIPKNQQVLASAALSAGWKITKGRGNHLKWYDPQGRMVTVTPGTESRGRGVQNLRACLARAGLQVGARRS